MTAKPAIALVAVPGRRKRAVELAQEIERAGFAGIYCPTTGTDCMALAQAVAEATREIRVGTAVQPIYYRAPADLARHASFIQEVSGGRFELGIGVSHAPSREALGVTAGKPLGDTRAYVEAMRAAEPSAGPLPPIILAALRDKMLALSTEISQGAVWACASLRDVGPQMDRVPQTRRAGFFRGAVIPAVIDEDEAAAAGVIKTFLNGYLQLPNYRNYWKAAGYGEEMARVEAAIGRGETTGLADLVDEAFMRDIALYGRAARVRDGVDAWRAAGVDVPILVPASVRGGQATAVAEVI
ncbi:MAG: LLM class flavin-dependent oxidoreductase, partial [Caulobacter sp.]